MFSRHTVLAALAAATVIGLSPSGCSPVDWEAPPVPGVLKPPPPLSEASSDVDEFGDDDDGPTKPNGKGPKPQGKAEVDLKSRIANFVPVTITSDVSTLPAGEKQALDKLIAASKLLDPLFDRQAYTKNPEIQKTLSGDKLTYFKIMRGPWDRQDEYKPFAIGKARPPGAGFYPEDLTAAQLDAYLKKHPDQQKSLLGLFTVVERKGKQLIAVPYSQKYAEWLKPAAALMLEAAQATKNETLSRFLRSRAAAFLSDDYRQSDMDWMDLDSRVEVTIGPYEVYEDELKASKASFESFVTVADPVASAKLDKYKKLLPDMEANLPVPDEVKASHGQNSPIRVVDLVFASGDARKSVQTIAFNLPNDEEVRKLKGSKKVMLRNVIDAKYERLLKPIALRVMAPEHHADISVDGFFNETLFHELSHSLGPTTIKVGDKEVEVREALQDTYPAIEECKADVMGAYNVLFMIKKKQFKASFKARLLVTYFAGLFRSVRFGVAEAHGQGAAVQLNRFIEAGAATFDPQAKVYKLDLAKLEQAISDLVHDLVMLQHKGDKAAARQILDKYGVMAPNVRAAIAKLDDLPIDLLPTYPLAGEP